MSNIPDSKTLTREECQIYLHDSIFKLESPCSCQYCGENFVGAVGIEVEMVPVIDQPGQAKPKPLSLESGEKNLFALLRQLAGEKDWKLEEYMDDSDVRHVSRVLLHENDNLSFEPGGQFEFSSKPYPCLSRAAKRIKNVQKILEDRLATQGVTLLQLGINPWHTVHEIGLQFQKPRYRSMDQYFSRIGEYGQRMMRQTCTVQVNLDYGKTENRLTKRYLASCLIAPYAAAIFANSGIVDGKLADMPGFRSKVWRHTDPSRTGLPDLSLVGKQMTKKACVETVFQYLMNSNVIYLENLECRVPQGDLSFGQWIDEPYEGISPTLKDLCLQLSLLFPEVRPRGFLELRSVDCQARVWQTVPASFFIGLLYDDNALDEVLDLLHGEIPRNAQLLELSSRGLEDDSIAENAVKLNIAREGLSTLPQCFIEEGCDHVFEVFCDLFTSRKRVPAQDLMDDFKKAGGVLSIDMIKKLEERWVKKIES